MICPTSDPRVTELHSRAYHLAMTRGRTVKGGKVFREGIVDITIKHSRHDTEDWVELEVCQVSRKIYAKIKIYHWWVPKWGSTAQHFEEDALDEMLEAMRTIMVLDDIANV